MDLRRNNWSKFKEYALQICLICQLYFKSSNPALKFLLSVSASDVRSVTGSNLRSIQTHTGVQFIPRVLNMSTIKKHRMFPVPEDQQRKVPLIHSLLAIKLEEFEIPCDEEYTDDNNVVDTILENICTC